MNKLTSKALLTLALGSCLASLAQAGPPLSPAPDIDYKPIPTTGTGLLDIDFRNEDYLKLNIIKVTTEDGELVTDIDCDDNPNDGDPSLLDGLGIGFSGDGSDCDDGIDRGESITVTVDAGDADGQAAFDINGIWLTDFTPDKKGDAGEIDLTGVTASDNRAYRFSAKDIDKSQLATVNPNGDLFVGFGETLRMTAAVISGSSGRFSVAGFAQTPIDIIDGGACPSNPGGNTDACKAELAKNVFLDLEASKDKPGDRGVGGTIFKNGVYVIQDTRGHCKLEPNGEAPRELSIHLNADNYAELKMQPHQCGYPESPGGIPVIYVLDIDGSRLDVAEDTITARFEDDSNDAGTPDIYFCDAPDPAFRPAYGWLPKSAINPTTGRFDEIPVLDAAGEVVRDLQDVTTGPCGSGRGDFSRYSYVVYHWVNRVEAADTTYDAVISDRILQLQAYVDGLFPCVQQGVNQSTLSSDVGRIQKSFAGGRYDQALGYVREMRQDVLDPRLNDEIAADGCFFDLMGESYSYTPDYVVNQTVPANAVGNLLVQLNHLEWMIRTTVLE
ncbi:hypothetical protein CWI75_12920 [Kineobactrum sediminis]|uniref:Uncharacterized protein n=1 Tax=Kineobactrum sediminis TaxID=1905677 RepID=A0A2N5Y0R3_9GAMM|nr:hypothetical protein [Kineobactrum sediminis]PLW81987.1 hypothetical protein CWI75_12920 [Kineobactrum sediminis]